ncbi:hypothetical protein MJO29_015356 [Puccinia striiformis f. sp. tritici]|uniref:DUF202 domain-containing protein n=2 Tax=Puccinia striiformis TaxID=27350 RepID=A0A0L0W2J2_9BASI
MPSVHSPLTSWPLNSPSIIPNEGSTARDHLGQDRTWLQWIRLSSLSLLVALATYLNFALTSEDDDDGDDDHGTKPFIIAFLGLAVFLPLVGWCEFLSVHRSMSMKRAVVQSEVFPGFVIVLTCSILIMFIFCTNF